MESTIRILVVLFLFPSIFCAPFPKPESQQEQVEQLGQTYQNQMGKLVDQIQQQTQSLIGDQYTQIEQLLNDQQRQEQNILQHDVKENLEKMLEGIRDVEVLHQTYEDYGNIGQISQNDDISQQINQNDIFQQRNQNDDISQQINQNDDIYQQTNQNDISQQQNQDAYNFNQLSPEDLAGAVAEGWTPTGESDNLAVDDEEVAADLNDVPDDPRALGDTIIDESAAYPSDADLGNYPIDDTDIILDAPADEYLTEIDTANQPIDAIDTPTLDEVIIGDTAAIHSDPEYNYYPIDNTGLEDLTYEYPAQTEVVDEPVYANIDYTGVNEVPLDEVETTGYKENAPADVIELVEPYDESSVGGEGSIIGGSENLEEVPLEATYVEEPYNAAIEPDVHIPNESEQYEGNGVDSGDSFVPESTYDSSSSVLDNVDSSLRGDANYDGSGDLPSVDNNYNEVSVPEVPESGFLTGLKDKWNKWTDKVDNKFTELYNEFKASLPIWWEELQTSLQKFSIMVQKGCNGVAERIVLIFDETKSGEIVHRLEKYLNEGNELVDRFFQKVGEKITAWEKETGDVDPGLLQPSGEHHNLDQHLSDLFQDPEIMQEMNLLVSDGILTQSEMDMLSKGYPQQQNEKSYMAIHFPQHRQKPHNMPIGPDKYWGTSNKNDYSQ